MLGELGFDYINPAGVHPDESSKDQTTSFREPLLPSKLLHACEILSCALSSTLTLYESYTLLNIFNLCSSLIPLDR